MATLGVLGKDIPFVVDPVGMGIVVPSDAVDDFIGECQLFGIQDLALQIKGAPSVRNDVTIGKSIGVMAVHLEIFARSRIQAMGRPVLFGGGSHLTDLGDDGRIIARFFLFIGDRSVELFEVLRRDQFPFGFEIVGERGGLRTEIGIHVLHTVFDMEQIVLCQRVGNGIDVFVIAAIGPWVA